jgi:glycosyltransferase involved in cell wall biosynthesis
MLHLVIPTHNAGRFTQICIDSIKSQTLQDYHVTLIDDDSIDGTYQNAIQAVAGDPRFKVSKNVHNVGALKNINDAIYGAKDDPADTIVVMIDGDDYLIDNDALQIIADTYKNTGCVATYGQILDGWNNLLPSHHIPPEWHAEKSYRKNGWGYNQIRTFHHGLFLQIDPEMYFKHASGTWYRDTYDQAIMFCIFELSGGRIAFIEKPLYRIGIGYRSDGESQRTIQAEVQAKPICTPWDGVVRPRQGPSVRMRSVAQVAEPPKKRIRVDRKPRRR